MVWCGLWGLGVGVLGCSLWLVCVFGCIVGVVGCLGLWGVFFLWCWYGNIYWCMVVEVFCGSGFCCGECGARVVFDDVHDEFVCVCCGLVYPDLGVVVEECDGAP